MKTKYVYMFSKHVKPNSKLEKTLATNIKNEFSNFLTYKELLQ